MVRNIRMIFKIRMMTKIEMMFKLKTKKHNDDMSIVIEIKDGR